MQACNLSAIDLACRRGDRVLFRGLQMDVASGQALHVAGANGIGKSSLIRILAGLLKPFAGAVSNLGSIGLVDERPALDPQVPLGNALQFWANADAADHDANSRLTDQLGLTDLLDVPVRFLSTGQKKRAAFARLLGQNAPIWLLDEPLNGLDHDGVMLVESLVETHCAAGGLAIVASHQPIRLPGDATLALREFAV